MRCICSGVSVGNARSLGVADSVSSSTLGATTWVMEGLSVPGNYAVASSGREPTVGIDPARLLKGSLMMSLSRHERRQADDTANLTRGRLRRIWDVIFDIVRFISGYAHNVYATFGIFLVMGALIAIAGTLAF